MIFLLAISGLTSCHLDKEIKNAPCICDEQNLQLLELRGSYQGKNLYIQNPSIDASGFSTKKVYINDSLYSSDINSSAFELKFTSLKMEIGDSINVKLYYCCYAPKVLNPVVN